MDVIVVAVISRAERDDRLELFGTSSGDLKPVEASPGDAHHADGPSAPRLRRDPLQNLQGVILLLLEILAEEDAFRVS